MSPVRKNVLFKNQGGFGLIEAVITLAIMSLITLGIASSFTYAGGAQVNIQSVSDFNDLFAGVQMAMDSTKVCTANFIGLQVVNLNPPTQEITLFSILPDGSHGPVMAQQGMQYSNYLTVTDVSLSLQAQLSADRVIAKVTLAAAKGQTTLGTKAISESFPVLAYVDPFGKITSCYGNFTAGGMTDLQQQICDLTSNGNLYYDPISGTCKPRFITQCTPGTPNSATCGGTGAVGLANPSCTSNTGQNDTRQLTRMYTDGIVRSVPAPSHYVCDQSGPISVSCVYASDYTVPPGTVCSACCSYDVTLMPPTP